MRKCFLLMGLLLSIIVVNAQSNSGLNRDFILFDQAQYVTDSAIMPNGCNLSRLQGTQNALGTYANWSIDHGQTSILADDFATDTAIIVTGLEVYAYQTDSDTTESSFTGFYCQIYDGNPMEGGQPIWGDMNDNILSETGFTRCYRGNDFTNTSRPLMYIRATDLFLVLQPGQYWLVWTLKGSLPSGPWALPRTLLDEVETGDAMQKTSSGWEPLIDGGSNTPYGMAMQIMGYILGPEPHDIMTHVFPEEAGSVEGAGTYYHGDTCTLIATPSEEKYHFYHWIEADTIVSEVDTFSFVVYDDREFTACFFEDSITISAVAEPELAGTIQGTGQYTLDDICTLEAVANEGYQFVEWREEDTLVSYSPELSFIVAEDRSFVAVFEIESFDVTIEASPEGYGSVTGDGTYLYGDVCTVSATAYQYHRFVDWTVDGEQVSTDAVYSFVVTGDLHLVANFEMNTYDITAIAVPEEGGTINGTGTYLYGENALLIASPTGSYSFLNWMEDGIIISTSATLTFPVTGPRSLIANFAQGTAAVTATVNPDESGSVEGAGNFIIGTTCTLKATANSGYDFVNWTENGNIVSEEIEYTFVVPGDRSLVANFTKQTFAITVSQNPQLGGVISGSGSYLYGAQAILKARANDNYEFESWTENGMVISTEPTYTFTVVANRDFVANFVEKIVYFTIDIESDNEEAGMVMGGGEFQAGHRCTLTAIPFEGYSFRNWTEYGNIVSNMAEYSFDVDRSRSLVAHFKRNVYTITAVAASNGTITPSGTIQVEHGGSQAFTITPDASYKVKKVFVDGVDMGSLTEYEFTNVTADHNIHVTFEQGGAVEEASQVVKIYPNPTSDAVTICGEEVKEVNIFDMQGRLVDRWMMTDVEMRLDLSQYESGIYFLKMQMIDGKVLQQRIVKY